MNKFIFPVLFFLCPAPARAAGAVAAVSTPAVTGHPITIFGNPAVIKERPETAAPGLVPQVPAEFRGSGPKPEKKKKKRAAPLPPPEKKAEAKPPKRKLVPVSFYDRWEAQRGENCEWYLGKVFIPVYDSGPARGIDLRWRPDPEPPVFRFGYWRKHLPALQQGSGGKKR